MKPRADVSVTAGYWGSNNNLKAVEEARHWVELVHQGKYEEAIAHYRSAEKLDSNLPEIHLNLELAYFKTRKLRDTASALERAVRADQGSFEVHALLGMSY